MKKNDPKIELVYIGQKGDQFAELVSKDPNFSHFYTIRAGKFRRYPSDGWKQFIDVVTFYKNLRDFFFVLIGLFEAYFILRKIKPKIVFSRGGFVSVPVCIGAHWNKINYITHDSDLIPSLANRIIAPWATAHVVAFPIGKYKYKQGITYNLGIPVDAKFKFVSDAEKNRLRSKLNISQTSKVILVIGGGQGARDLNNIFIGITDSLVKNIPDLDIIHIVGKNNYKDAIHKYDKIKAQHKVKILDYTEEVYAYSGAADLIITRAGATNLAEFAIQGKPLIIIPSSYLASGHQIENARFLVQSKAALMLNDITIQKNPDQFEKLIISTINNKKLLKELSHNIAKFANSEASDKIAKLIINLN